MEIKTKYDLKQWVYLLHDPDQRQRMITGIHVLTPKLFSYDLCSADDQSTHFEYEISLTKNELFATTGKNNEDEN